MPRPQSDFCTLTEMRRRNAIPQNGTRAHFLTADPVADPALRSCIRYASRLIEQVTKRTFLPYLETRSYDAVGQHIGAGYLNLDEDLLELTSMTNGDETAISTSSLSLASPNFDPKWQIRIKPTSNVYWTYNTNWMGVITVTGVWGFHDQWAQAWANTTDEVENNPLSSSGASLTVNDADGLNEDGGYRFEVGQLLKIETEYLLVTNVDPPTNTITVRRGVHGTTAAAHNQNTAIYSYCIPGDVNEACSRIATWAYQRRDTASGEVQFLDTNVVLRDSSVQSSLAMIAHRSRHDVGIV